VKIDLNPSVYFALCGLVKDALEVQTDATPLLRQAALQLAAAAAEVPEQAKIAAPDAWRAIAALGKAR